MDLYGYDVRSPDGLIVHHLSPLPHDLAVEHGLPPEAVLGSVPAGEPMTVDSVRQNRAFVDFLHQVIAKHAAEAPGLIAAARGQHDVYVYIIDARTPTPEGEVPPEDIIGGVRVEHGRIGEYKPNESYRALGRHGPMQLEPWFEARFLAELAGRARARTTERQTKKSAEPRLVFRDGSGRELTTDDLANATGRVSWEVIGTDQIDPRAEKLHREGRKAGSEGDGRRALALFDSARELAPQWPYPVYDAAFTCLLAGDTKRAHELYAAVDRMAPRGFFTAKTSLHSLTRELAGELPAGFCRSYAMLEFTDDRAQKRAALTAIVARHPDFAPAWKDLASLLEDDTEQERAVERGLAAQPDPETRGILLIHKALIQDRHGDMLGAIDILGTAALDPQSTLGTEMLAKATIAQLHRQRGLAD